MTLTAALSALQNPLHQGILDSLPLGILLFNADGTIAYANPATEKMLGISLAEMAGKKADDPLWHAIHEDGSPFLGQEYPVFQALSSGQAIFDVVVGIFQPFQKLFKWLKLSAVPQRSHPDLPPHQVVVTLEDITDRKRTEDALHEEQRRLKLAVTAASIGFWRSNLRTREVYYSPEWKRILGYEDHELANDDKTWLSVLHPDDLPLVKTRFNDYLANPHPDFEMEFRMRHKDGSYRWILSKMEVTAEEPGKPDAIVIGAHIDITRYKTAEQALYESTEDYRSLVDILDMAVSKVDREGRLVFVNKHGARNLGKAPVDLIGQKISDLFPPVFVEKSMPLIRKVIDEKQGQSMEFHLQIAGKPQWFMTKIQPIFNLKGVATHAVILSTEITPFKLAQQTLETHARELGQANAELTSANRAKSEFLSMMSHELRTPLNTVLTLSESLEEGIYGEVTSLQASRLKMVHSSGTHLLSIINDILDYSKIDSGQLDLYPEITEIDELCKIALQSIRPQMARKKQRLTTTIADGGEVILIDQHRVHQILTNLLSNAVKFTPDGGNIGLEVSLENHGSALRMTVWDSGIGIPNDQLQTIFQPFVQLDSSLDRRYEGTGLGLTSVQRLVERMGGSVGVSSQPGEGSRFWVFLPVTGPAAPPVDPTSVDQASQPAEAGDQEVEGTQNRLILLVEDNLDTLNALQDVLEAHHFRVISACNGLEAIRQAEAAQPDLILMDIQMPGMNGLEATHRLRANKTFASTPIIALTALVTPGDRERCLEAGVNEYFTKPVQIKTLLVSIAALLKSGPEQPHTSQS